jgi:hypothetical protein
MTNRAKRKKIFHHIIGPRKQEVQERKNKSHKVIPLFFTCMHEKKATEEQNQTNYLKCKE